MARATGHPVRSAATVATVATAVRTTDIAHLDTLLKARVDYTKDRREKGSEIFGEDERLNNYDVGLSKNT